MTMQEKQWIIADPAPKEWQEKFPELPPILRQLLWNRGIESQEAIDEFLNPDYEDLHDPYLFKDMEKAVELIFTAIAKKEKIGVYGDYDADGITGAVILVSTLKALGAQTEVYLPNREKEGYGLNKEAVNFLIKKGVKLIVTCDCGIANFEEVALAKYHGTDVIITDHHHVPEQVPPADAILHPLVSDSGYPFKGLTGGGVAYKFAHGLILKDKRQKVKGKIEEGFEKWLLDLVAISTVADVGKLIGENRTLVKYGLMVLRKTRRLGLLKLYEVAGIKQAEIDAWSIAFQITPRINAAGRMDHANAAYKLLISQDEGEARQLALDLNKSNSERQQVTEKIINDAKKQMGDFKKYFLSAYTKEWPAGVIGLAAGRIADEFYKPTMIGCENTNGQSVGSIRSIGQFNIIEALEESKDLMAKFGGHPKAAGFSLRDFSQWPLLVNHLEETAKMRLRGFDLRPALKIDTEISLVEANWDLCQILEMMEPFGEGNSQPKFLSTNVRIIKMDIVGNGQKHLRLNVADDSNLFYKMIGFSFGERSKSFSIGDKIDVVFELGVNEWNGNRELQLKIVDFRPADL